MQRLLTIYEDKANIEDTKKAIFERVRQSKSFEDSGKKLNMSRSTLRRYYD